MDIDEKVMIPMFYDNYEEYYENTDMIGKVHKIQTPTFFLSAHDDPIIRKDLYPFKEFEGNPYVIAGFTKKGGHCGHVAGGFKPNQWFTLPLMEFLNFNENST